MYYYFSANSPTALKLNGAYFGVLGDDKKQVNVLSPNALIELCPLSQSCPPTSFILNDEFLASPPQDVKVVDLKGGYYIYYERAFFKQNYGVITQKRLSLSVVTVFYDGGLKLSIETKNDFFTGLIPDGLEFNEIIELAHANAIIITTTCGAYKRILVFSISKEIKQIFDYTADAFEIKDTIKAIEKKRDILKHEILSEWQIEGDNVTLINKNISAGDKKEKLAKNIIPYAFLEEFLVGGDYAYYMCDSMKANAQKLKGYLGEFLGVMPPPHFIPFDQIGLIRKISDRLYRVDYLTVTLDNDKITNIKLN